MKKIALIILTAFALNLALFAIPMAGHATAATEAKPANANNDITDYKKTFNVKKNLILQDTPVPVGDSQVHEINQEAKYFEGEGSPIVNFISSVIEYLTYIIGSIAMILVIVSGFRMMVSQGNQQKIDEAKEMFKFAIIGLVVVFMSYIITIFVQSIFISAN